MNWKLETGDWRPEVGDRRPEVGDRRTETFSDASGIEELQRREMEASLLEWRGFWVGLLLCLTFSATLGIVIFAFFYQCQPGGSR